MKDKEKRGGKRIRGSQNEMHNKKKYRPCVLGVLDEEEVKGMEGH